MSQAEAGKGGKDRTTDHDSYRRNLGGIDWSYTRNKEQQEMRDAGVPSGAGGDTIMFRDKASYERARDFVDGKMVCKNCKHFILQFAECKNKDVVDYIDAVAEFFPPADFGCNKWELKE